MTNAAMPDFDQHLTILGTVITFVTVLNGAIFGILFSMVKGIQATLNRDHVHRDEFDRAIDRLNANSGRVAALEAQVRFLSERFGFHVHHDDPKPSD